MSAKVQVAFRLRQDLIARLEEWCRRQRPAVTKTAVIEEAIASYLDAEGHRGTTHRVGGAHGAERKEVTR